MAVEDYTSVRVHSIFADASAAGSEEKFLALFENDSVKIERIVSNAHSSPAGFWYDQAEHEWVMLVRGQAMLEFVDGTLVELKEGDYLTILPHLKHRVRQTATDTIWLAVRSGGKGQRAESKAERAKRTGQSAKGTERSGKRQRTESEGRRAERKTQIADSKEGSANHKGQKK
jgi:cupin 2 domain-containing protein